MIKLLTIRIKTLTFLFKMYIIRYKSFHICWMRLLKFNNIFFLSHLICTDYNLLIFHTNKKSYIIINNIFNWYDLLIIKKLIYKIWNFFPKHISICDSRNWYSFFEIFWLLVKDFGRLDFDYTIGHLKSLNLVIDYM